MEVYVTSFPFLGNGEGAAVGAHFIAVLVGGEPMVLGLAHHALLPVIHFHFMIEDDRLVDIYGHTPFHGAILLQSLHVPAAGNLYVVPCRDVICGQEEVCGTLFGIAHPMELPSPIQALVVGASFGKYFFRFLHRGEGEGVGTWLLLVEGKPGGVLPFLSVRRRLLPIEESFE